MKTRLLWALILSVGSIALYFGIVRPEVSTTPKRIRDFVEADPATRPPIKLPSFVVSEPRLPPAPTEAPDPSSASPVSAAPAQTRTNSVLEAPDVSDPDQKDGAKNSVETTGEAMSKARK